MKVLGKKELIVWSAVLALSWAAVILLVINAHGKLTVDEILNYHPDDLILSAGVMVGLYALKSVDFIMHSAVLFTASGIMFPLPWAFLLNCVGSLIMVTPLYVFGRRQGPRFVSFLREKNKKLAVFDGLAIKNRLILTLLLRSTGLSMHLVSLYLGALGTRYDEFAAGTLLGLAPMLVIYTVLGKSAGDPGSPGFIISAVAGVVFPLISMLTFFIIKKKEKAACGEVTDDAEI